MSRRRWKEFQFRRCYDMKQVHSVVANSQEPGVEWYFDFDACVLWTNASWLLIRAVARNSDATFPEALTVPDDMLADVRRDYGSGTAIARRKYPDSPGGGATGEARRAIATLNAIKRKESK